MHHEADRTANVVQLAKRGRVNEVNVPFDEPGERDVGAIAGVFAEQIQIGRGVRAGEHRAVIMYGWRRT